MIGLITDFGTKDNFVGIVKGVMKNINPDVDIIDITHNVAPQNINEAAYALVTSYKYFAAGTIFLCVVDPTVGSERDALIVKTRDYYFVAPDNGIVSLVLDYEPVERIINITNTEFFLPDVSVTFHARDIFAPVAAHLSLDTSRLYDFGEEKTDIERLTFSRPLHDESVIKADVIHIDRFGNITTNIDSESFKQVLEKGEFVIEAGHAKIRELSSHYADGEDELCALFSSAGFLEIARFKASAADELEMKVGDKVTVLLA
jgi:S-adenosylmethionine hydrolase